MEQAQDGFLLIADITGYTAFLRESELEHAKDSLRSLLDLLIGQTKPPLLISRLEGDAVISYAPQGSFQKGQTLVELIEATYVEFRRALDLMVLNTTCNCLACRNIANLDLKFFVHYGTFALEPLPAYTELIGNDVNLIHRLTKNSVTITTGIRAYVLYTQAAIDHLNMPDMARELTTHVESYQDVGEVRAKVLDMHPIWEQRKHRFHRVIMPETASYIIERLFALPPAQMWEYLTLPKYRSILYGSDQQEIKDLQQGRVQDGSVYVCSHGQNTILQTIVDWHPFEQYTITNSVPGGGAALTTIQLREERDGTRVSLLVGKTEGGTKILRGLLDIVGRKMFKSTAEEGLEVLAKIIAEENTLESQLQSKDMEISGEQLEKAVAESLAEN